MTDTLSTLLDGVYVRGTVFGHARFHGDWSVYTRGADSAIFHAVVAGEAWISWNDGRDRQHLPVGSMAIVPRGTAHVMCCHPDRIEDPVWIVDVFADNDGDASEASTGDGELRCRVVCGTFHFDQNTPNRLLQALPEVIRIAPGAQQGWIEKTLHWISEELETRRPGAEVMLTRLTDALFIHVIRGCLEQAARDETPWLAALGDDRISRALAAIHERPDHPWTASLLARHAGMSRSAFYERFSELVGESPAQYLLERRMALAAFRLGDASTSVAEVARAVGYRSESSFSKAFKRRYGVPPSEYEAR